MHNIENNRQISWALLKNIGKKWSIIGRDLYMTVHACMYIHCACVLNVHHCMYACVHVHLHSHIASMIKTVFVKIRSKCTYVNLHVSLIEHSTRHYLSYARCYIWLWWVGNHDYMPLITHLFNWLTYLHVIPKGHANGKQCHTCFCYLERTSC